MLKGHGNEADFLGFLQKWFLIDPLHFLPPFASNSRRKTTPQLGESVSLGVAIPILLTFFFQHFKFPFLFCKAQLIGDWHENKGGAQYMIILLIIW